MVEDEKLRDEDNVQTNADQNRRYGAQKEMHHQLRSDRYHLGSMWEAAQRATSCCYHDANRRGIDRVRSLMHQQTPRVRKLYGKYIHQVYLLKKHIRACQGQVNVGCRPHAPSSSTTQEKTRCDRRAKTQKRYRYEYQVCTCWLVGLPWGHFSREFSSSVTRLKERPRKMSPEEVLPARGSRSNGPLLGS